MHGVLYKPELILCADVNKEISNDRAGVIGCGHLCTGINGLGGPVMQAQVVRPDHLCIDRTDE